MPAYVIAQLKFTDKERYLRYLSRFADVFAGSGGRLLAADEAPELLEGESEVDKVVMMAFDTPEAAKAFLQSPSYQDISRDRAAGAQTTAFLVRGL